jgi:hypothetical protein
MANSDKNIVITPRIGGTTEPTIVFTGQGNDPLTMLINNGVTGTGTTHGAGLIIQGSQGQLFSVVNRLGTGSIFSVNDISGIPSIDVDADGRVILAGTTGNVGIGITAPTERLHVAGSVLATTGFEIGSSAIDTKTGSYTLTATDNGKILIMNSSSGTTFTVPSGLTVGYSTTFISIGSGKVGISGASGVTLNCFGTSPPIILSGQHASASMVSYSTNIFNVSGSVQ